MIDRTPPDDLVAMLRASEGGADRGPECPAHDRIWDAASGVATPAEIESVLLHTASCGACSADWRLAVAMAEESGTARARTHRSPVRIASWALLAAALLAVAVLLPRRTGDDAPPAFREQPAEIRVVAPGSDEKTIPRDAFRLTWDPVPGAARYAVDVTSLDLRLLHAASGLTEAEVVVPPEKLGSVPADGTVLWRVTVTLGAGGSLTSPLFKTRVGGPP